AREAVLRAPVALHGSFRSPGGTDYPRVLMGAVAHCRQALLDAGHHARLLKTFEDGKLARRPPADAALEALQPALDGKLPVAIEADTRDEIDRALAFASEFRLKPILVGGRDAWKRADRLKAGDVPVLLRLDFDPPPDQKAVPARVRAERERV